MSEPAMSEPAPSEPPAFNPATFNPRSACGEQDAHGDPCVLPAGHGGDHLHMPRDEVTRAVDAATSGDGRR